MPVRRVNVRNRKKYAPRCRGARYVRVTVTLRNYFHSVSGIQTDIVVDLFLGVYEILEVLVHVPTDESISVRSRTFLDGKRARVARIVVSDIAVAVVIRHLRPVVRTVLANGAYRLVAQHVVGSESGIGTYFIPSVGFARKCTISTEAVM